jgi:hypothetical protein
MWAIVSWKNSWKSVRWLGEMQDFGLRIYWFWLGDSVVLWNAVRAAVEMHLVDAARCILRPTGTRGVGGDFSAWF